MSLYDEQIRARKASAQDDFTDSMYDMAGILKHIREITLFLNPSDQSYWRFGRMES